MRTLHFGLRVADLDRSLAFYTAVGYEIVGHVPETGLGGWCFSCVAVRRVR
jgi:lactoylglutathione lyase